MPTTRVPTASPRAQSRCNSQRCDVDSAALKISVVAPLGKPRHPHLPLRVRLDARQRHLHPRHALQHLEADHISDWVVVPAALFPVSAANLVVHVPDALYRDAAAARRMLQLVGNTMRSCGVSSCGGWNLSVSLWGPLGFESSRVWPFRMSAPRRRAQCRQDSSRRCPRRSQHRPTVYSRMSLSGDFDASSASRKSATMVALTESRYLLCLAGSCCLHSLGSGTRSAGLGALHAHSAQIQCGKPATVRPAESRCEHADERTQTTAGEPDYLRQPN
jgi:hypothetical protein